MGMGSAPGTRLADALFSPVQQRVLALPFGQPDRSFRSTELIALADSGTGAAHRPLVRLAESGLVMVTRVGNQKHYQANRALPVEKALAPFSERIHAAFISGSVAKGTDAAQSDIDLMVIGDDLTYPDLYSALQEAEATLQRPIHVSLATAAEWKRKLAAGNPFLTKIQAQPKTLVIGSTDDLA